MSDITNLASCRRGQWVRIRDLGSQNLSVQGIRLGLVPGDLVQCWENIRGGPVILRKGRREIAVGRNLASGIGVEVTPPPQVRRKAGVLPFTFTRSFRKHLI